MVTNILNKFVYRTLPIRTLCHNVSLNVERLTNRSVLKLCGVELYNFLQGLVTNDIFSLRNSQNSLYTFLLNNKGRILYDALIYKVSNTELLLECDSPVKDDIVKHIKQYCIRKKIEITPQDSSVWVIYNNHPVDFSDSNSAFRDSCQSLCSVIPDLQSEKIDSPNFYRDPRLIELGFRTISSSSVDVSQFLIDRGVNVSSSGSYRTYRYKLGVAEGVLELPVGSCILHEINGDFLNGISFDKGCYLGQELTARVQYTGVVRKRLMPIILSSVPDFDIKRDTPVTSKEGKNIGKINVLHGNSGIALMRVAEALENGSELRIADIPTRTYKPYWWNWPQEEQ